MKKIQLIESPEEAMLSQEEMEEILAGWTCGTYSSSHCYDYASEAKCQGNSNYCVDYSL